MTRSEDRLIKVHCEAVRERDARRRRPMKIGERAEIVLLSVVIGGGAIWSLFDTARWAARQLGF